MAYAPVSYNVLLELFSRRESFLDADSIPGERVVETRRREKKDLQFVMANGATVTRSAGFAIIRIGEHFTVDEVVFAEAGDLALLGARTLEGLSLVVDSRRKKLVAAGPIPAA